MPRVTLKEVAEKAGVTAATVSMILHGKNTFKETTVAKVRQALTDLNYFPNSTAQRLATRRTETVAFVLDNIESAFEVELLKGIQGRAVDEGYDILFQALATHRKTYGELVHDLVRSGKVDGVISMDQDLEPGVLAAILDTVIPFVLLENDNYRLDSVRSDNRAGGILAARHFLDRKVLRPAVVHGPLDSHWMRQRVEGFLETMAAGGTPVGPEARFAIDYEGDLMARGQDFAPNLLRDGRCPFDALFVAAGDETAMGAMQELQTRGIRIPQDLRVLGYDGIPSCQLIYPSLSTVNQDIQQLGVLAFQQLVARLSAAPGTAEEPRAQVLQPTLVLRQSSP